jgi:hypothetical protein
VVFTRTDPNGVRGYSVTIQLTNLALCGSVSFGTYLSGVGAVNQQVTNNADGTFTVDEVILGSPCGATGSATLFTLPVTNTIGDGIGTIAVTAVKVRDCANQPLPGTPGANGLITIDHTSPAALTALSASQQLLGNPAGDRTRIFVTWNTGSVESGGSVEELRKGFGDYPEYDDGAGVTPLPAPTTRAAAIAAGWTPVSGLTAPGFDRPPTRDFYYYIAFVTDGCGNTSLASGATAGTLDYHLGDVAPGTGDNVVDGLDISLLGFNYGISGAAVAPVASLDVGPTTDFSVDARPTTDDRIDFEDLIMFAINYGTVSAPQARALAVASPRDEISVEAPDAVAAGEVVTAQLMIAGAGDVQGLSARLAWDPAVVEPVGVAPSSWFANQNGVVFSPAPGGVDAALLGIGGIAGQGGIATVSFRAIAAGNPGIRVARVIARDSRNHPVALAPTAVEGARPGVTQLVGAAPNPFRESARLSWSLARAGRVELAIYSVDGRRVRTLVRGETAPGVYRTEWDGTDDAGAHMQAGVYFARLTAGGRHFTRALARLR